MRIDLERISKLNKFITGLKVNAVSREIVISTIPRDEIPQYLPPFILPEDVAIFLHLLTVSDKVTFSLDPENNQVKSKYQLKRFFPSCFRGCKLGENFFNADIDLKQMAMGVKAQSYVIPPDKKTPCEPWIFSPSLRAKGVDSFTNLTLKYPRVGSYAVRVCICLRDQHSLPTDSQGNYDLDQLCYIDYGELRIVDGKYTSQTVPPQSTSPIGIFAKTISDHFAEIAKETPSFFRILQVARAYFLAGFIHNNKLEVDRAYCKQMFEQNKIPDYGKPLESIIKGSIKCHKNASTLEGKFYPGLSINQSRLDIATTDKIYNLNMNAGSEMLLRSALILSGSKAELSLSTNIEVHGGVTFDQKFRFPTEPRVTLESKGIKCPIPNSKKFISSNNVYISEQAHDFSNISKTTSTSSSRPSTCNSRFIENRNLAVSNLKIEKFTDDLPHKNIPTSKHSKVIQVDQKMRMNILREAEQHEGNAYRSGGKGTGKYEIYGRPAFDCSGLVYNSTHQAIPGLTNYPVWTGGYDEQIKKGYFKEVAEKDMQEGDLVIWDKTSSKHVAFVKRNDEGKLVLFEAYGADKDLALNVVRETGERELHRYLHHEKRVERNVKIIRLQKVDVLVSK